MKKIAIKLILKIIYLLKWINLRKISMYFIDKDSGKYYCDSNYLSYIYISYQNII